jgi:hypothetical protein
LSKNTGTRSGISTWQHPSEETVASCETESREVARHEITTRRELGDDGIDGRYKVARSFS